MTLSHIPAARQHDLVTTEHDGEVLVFDQRTQHIHQLNQTAATVWRLCDGTRSLEAIANEAELELTGVELALQQLSVANLLDVDPTAEPAAVKVASRRKMLRTAGVMGAAAVPVIVSVTASTAGESQSPPGNCATTCSHQSHCQGGCCPQCNLPGHGTYTTALPDGICFQPGQGIGPSCN